MYDWPKTTGGLSNGSNVDDKDGIRSGSIIHTAHADSCLLAHSHGSSA